MSDDIELLSDYFSNSASIDNSKSEYDILKSNNDKIFKFLADIEIYDNIEKIPFETKKNIISLLYKINKKHQYYLRHITFDDFPNLEQQFIKSLHYLEFDGKNIKLNQLQNILIDLYQFYKNLIYYIENY